MPILSFSPAPGKNASSTATLDKSALYALTPISGDAFWSNSSNVKEVMVVYESSAGGQTKTMNFDATQASPEATIVFSASARDNFQLKHIVLKDSDDGELRMNRAELTALGVSLDLSLSGGGGLASTLALYHFDGNANGAYGNNLTTTGSLTYGAGKFGQGVSGFGDNPGSLKRDASFFNVGTGDFTIEFWIKFVGIVSQELMSICVDGQNSSVGPFTIRYDAGSEFLTLYKNGTSLLPVGVSGKRDDQWHHIVFQRSSGVINGFVNGAVASSGSFTDSIPASGNVLNIGGASGYQYFYGNLDELRFSNAAMYNTAGFAPPTQPLT